MKRRDLVRHLEANGCELLREGGKHSVYVNRRTRKSSTVPRHREVNEHLARKICRDLEIPVVCQKSADPKTPAIPEYWRLARSSLSALCAGAVAGIRAR